jgi:serine/threonine protein kinase
MPYIFAISLGGGLLICIAFIIMICICISIKRKKDQLLRQKKRDMLSELDFQVIKKYNDFELPDISPNFDAYLRNVTLMGVIGIGKYGEVWWATYKSIDTKVACKCSRDEKESSSETTQLKKEIAIHKTIHHPNIIQFLGTFISQRKHCVIKQEFLVMEYAENGSAKAYLKKHTHIGWDFILKICIQISGAMNYLHGESILHRDIAGRNILLKSDLTAKLCDFGMARRLNPKQISFEDPSDSEIPILWSSPETIKTREYSKMTDVWSFGVTMWELFMYGKDPWNTLSVPIAMDNIKNGITLELKSNAVPEMDPLLANIFEFLPLKRIDFNGINVGLYEIQDKYFKDKNRQSLYNDEPDNSDEEIKYNNLLLDQYF